MQGSKKHSNTTCRAQKSIRIQHAGLQKALNTTCRAPKSIRIQHAGLQKAFEYNLQGSKKHSNTTCRAPKSIRIQLGTEGVSGGEGKGEGLLQLQKGGGFVAGDHNTDTDTNTHWNSSGDACSDLFIGDIDPKLELACEKVRAFYL
jgi:hypothetical protein